jgi:hypothetical protein
MKALTRTIAGAAFLLAVAACFRQQAVEISPQREAAARAWTAKLVTPPALRGAVQAQGTATMGPPHWENDDGNGNGNDNGDADGAVYGTVVEVVLSNVAPGGLHPWRVQTGRCGQPGSELLLVMDETRMLKVRSDGTARATAHLPSTPVPKDGDYAIAVLASRDNQDVVIACGNFAPPPLREPSDPPPYR